MKDISKLVDADTYSHLQAIKGGPLFQEVSVETARQMLDEYFEQSKAPERMIADSRDFKVAVNDGNITVRVYWPEKIKRTLLPGVLWFHGGGWTIGSMASMDSVCRYICHEAGVVVINVDYRLAPEHKFPIPVEDAYSALCWTAETALELGIDKERLAVSGTSAGGSLTITCCLLAKLRGGPMPRFQIPVYPCLSLLDDHGYASREKFGGGEFGLSNDEINWLFSNYLDSPEDAFDLRASPALYDDFSNFPEALVITAGMDPLLDDGIDYFKRLERAGVRAEYRCFETTIHGFTEIPGRIGKGLDSLNLLADRLKKKLF